MIDQNNLLRTNDNALPVDLGPLSWVVDSLRDILQGVNDQLLQFSSEAEAASGSHLTTLDTTSLRMAVQSLHEAVGVLDLVERPAAAKVVSAMERSVQLFVSSPQLCTHEAAQTIVKAGVSVLDYLTSALKGHPDLSVGLFPAYRDAAKLAGFDRIHPADLWHHVWQWLQISNPSTGTVIQGQGGNASFFESVLQVFQTSGQQGAQTLAEDMQKNWQNSINLKERVFWQLATAYFQIQTTQALPFDEHAKRLLSRIVIQYDLLQQGTGEVSERLAHDMLYFIALGGKSLPETQAPIAHAIIRRYGLDHSPISAYDNLLYGSVDPALHDQLCQGILIFKELWSDICAGDAQKMNALSDQADRIALDIRKLWPTATNLPNALLSAIQKTKQTGQDPVSDMAMEIATAVLFLEAAAQGHQNDDPQFVERTNLLARRLTAISNNEQIDAMPEWMEALYARINDHNSISQIASESRATMGEIEQALDDFFRHPQKTEQAQESIDNLSKIAGILEILDYEDASAAITAMSHQVKQLIETSMLTGSIDDEASQICVLRLGNSLGALAFMFDMMRYQPELAHSQFYFDTQHQQLIHRKITTVTSSQAHTKKSQTSAPTFESINTQIPALNNLIFAQTSSTLSYTAAIEQLHHVAEQAELADQPALAQQARQALAGVQTASVDDPGALAQALSSLIPAASIASAPIIDSINDSPIEEADLRDIFLEEAAEVINSARKAIEALDKNLNDMTQLTNLRRAFHTLKGSGRMVGLASFGEAAWELERLLNSWLADSRPATKALLDLADSALDALTQWRQSIALQERSLWHHSYFSYPAAQMQEHGSFVAIVIPETAALSGTLITGEEATPAVTPSSTDTETAIHGAETGTLFEPPLEPLFTFNEEPVQVSAAIEPLFTFNEEPVQASAAIEPSLFIEDSAAPVFRNDTNNDKESLSLAPSEISSLSDEGFASEEELFLFAAKADANVLSEKASTKPSAPTENDTWPLVEVPPTKEPALFSESQSTAETVPLPTDQPARENDAFTIATSDLLTPAFDENSPATSDQQPVPSLASEYPTASINRALAAILVDTSPQLSVLHDMAEGLPEDEVKHIGNMRIPLVLFNTYLNEADAWSRQLVQELGEWVLDDNKPISSSCIQLAHSLAGSSAAVGMGALASMARGIEHATAHIMHHPAQPDEAKTILHAAETVRQGLHQFAAGLQRPVDMLVLYKLAAIADNIPLHTIEATFKSSASDSDYFTSIEKIIEGSDTDSSPTSINSSSSTTEQTTSAQTCLDDARSNFPQIQEQESSAKEFQSAFSRDLASESITNTASSSTITATSADKDTQNAISPELFDIFRQEGEILLRQLSAVMRQWTARPDNEGARQETMRLLHTLKGSARLAGAMQLGTMAHDMESAIGRIGALAKNEQSAQQLGFLQDMLDDIDSLFNQLLGTETSIAACSSRSKTTSDLYETSNNPVSNGTDFASTILATANPSSTIAPPFGPEKPAENKITQQVRVRPHILDRMLSNAGEIMTSRAQLETEVQQLRQAMTEMGGSIDRLRTQLRDMELQAETQMQSRMAQTHSAESADHFDPLEFDRFTRVQELTRMMAESVNDVASVQRSMVRSVQSTEESIIAQTRQTKELQGDLLRTRMVEFDSLSERLYRVVRQTAKEEGKQVILDIVGGQIEMDRSIIERIASSFEHLLRNAVVHGIESPEKRVQMGKEPTGRIEIRLRQEGNDIAISLHDDGQGLDVLRIRDKAIENKFLQADSNISEEEAAQLIFQNGLSTANAVTSLAGRGVGLDVVRTEVNALGGRIAIKSHQHLGTEFTLLLPLTTAVTQVVELQAGDLRFSIPSNLIESVRRTTAKEIQHAYNSQSFTVDNEDLPFYWGGAILQSSRSSNDMTAKHQIVLVLRSATQRIVMHIDTVHGNHEVVVKNIGPQLARMPGLAGITIRPNSSLLFIYNPVALSLVYEEQIRAFGCEKASPSMLGGEGKSPLNTTSAQANQPLILVVDDSITVRRVTERLLKREGYRVALAIDGITALRELETEKPALVLSDIEMPQMDGFDLLRNIRDDENLKNLPVIMITSRTADKHREHAQQLGATAFLGKPYPEDQLMELIHRYTHAQPIT